MSDWKVNGGVWLAHLASAERAYDIPTDLLARIAYEESHFRDDIIRGEEASPAGALGIMQLMPKFFLSVRVPTPFTDVDVAQQIDEAAQFLAHLNDHTHDWQFAVAAYNAGLGNVEKYAGIPPFPETEKYVADITADVPLKEA
jgi:soluble lytic murein transglycosylase-like protein